MIRKFTIQGRVQGVGYRYFALNEAQKLEIKGTVRNLYNGDVEVVAEAEKEILELYLDKLKNGPSFGRVDHVFTEELEEEKDFTTFRILY